MNTKFLLWLEHLDATDLHLVGEKAVSLSQLCQAGFPVPKGFVITSDAYKHFLEANNLQGKITKILSTLDARSPEDLLNKSTEIKKLLTSSPFPDNLKTEILSHYTELAQIKTKARNFLSVLWGENPFVTIINHRKKSEAISGEANFAEKIREFWASEFDPHLLHTHPNRQGYLIVQSKLSPEIYANFYSVDPETDDKDKILLSVGMDRYEIDRKNPSLINPQILRNQKIPRPLMNKLVELFLKLEKHHYFPLKAEFAVEEGEMYLTNFSPLTQPTTEQGSKLEGNRSPTINHKKTLIGLPGSPGRKTAPAKIIKHPKEAYNKIFPGDILVTAETDNRFLHIMKKTSAIITEKGDKHSHAAVFAKHRGIPSLVGVSFITSKIKDGQVVTVDGIAGEVII